MPQIEYTRFQVDIPAKLQARLKAAMKCIPRPEGGGSYASTFAEMALEERLERMAVKHNDGKAWEADTESPLVVYFCRDPHRGNTKIGRTTNLEHRLVTMRTSAPDLELLCWVEDADPGLEAELHARWKDFSAGGEWFTLDGVADYAEWVDKNATWPDDVADEEA